jgi:hypothetical protein
VRGKEAKHARAGSVLFRFGDDAAGDARWTARAAAFCSVNNDGRAAVGKYGMLIAAHGDAGGNDGDVRGAIVGDDQEEIRNVAGHGAAAGVARGIKVWTGGLEIGRIAFGVLMNVHGVLAGRKILDIEFEADAIGSAGEGRGAHRFALGILNIDDHRFAVRGIILRERWSGDARKEYGKR